ncbi:hypothetical protein QUV83_02920 [Cellulomonas cellasea]|uniref:hypothetical protein n=1 Tax=Cellulomonas cellasea TaxID=43670 RepID=UPI0025A4C5BE|nr:hypothetical protein [Cellulomonas cellasea]MDM8083716.1 hypothetical protein [Cellulomonas cellasea]
MDHDESEPAETMVPGCVARVQLAGQIEGMSYVVGPVWVWNAQVEYLVIVLEPPGSLIRAADVQMLTGEPGEVASEHSVIVLARQPGLALATPVHEPRSVRGVSRTSARSSWLMRLAPASPDHDLVVSIRGAGEIIEVTIDSADLLEGQRRQIKLWEQPSQMASSPTGLTG